MKKKSNVCIIGGLGHVGLPLGIALANQGTEVTLYDLDQKKIDLVSQGKMPFLEEGAQDLLNKVLNKTLFISDNKTSILENYFIVIVIGTPVDEHLNPQFTVFKKFFDEILDFITDDQHIIFRSTVFPGTTEKIKEYLSSKGKNPKMSFCPERIAQGFAIRELQNLPQIVASFDESSHKEATELFTKLTKETIPLEPFEAELAKIFINVWRYIQFSISNQFYQIATHQNLDWYRIYEAITRNYPRAEGFPTAGFAAGPCLFKDTMQLAAFSNNNFFLGHAAMLINEGLPNFIVQRLKEKFPLNEKTVGILGMSFKANNDDKRDSLSYKLKKILEIEAQKVLCSDVYIKEPGFISPKNLIEEADIVILGSPHREYHEFKIPKDKILVDVWNSFGRGGNF